MKEFLVIILCLFFVSFGIFASIYDDYSEYYLYYDDFNDDKYYDNKDWSDSYQYDLDSYYDYYDDFDDSKENYISNIDTENTITEEDEITPKVETIDDIVMLGFNNSKGDEFFTRLEELQKNKENIPTTAKVVETEEDEITPKVEAIDDIIMLGFNNSNGDEFLTRLEELQKNKENAPITTKTVETPTETASNVTTKKQGFFVDGSFGPTVRVLRGLNLAVGGHIAVNFFVVPEFSFGPYIHGEYFFAPLGSKSGLLAGLEMELEAGINFTFPLYKGTHFAIKLGADFGYYMQWLQYNSDISTDAHLTYNGLIIRPTLTFDFTHLWGMPIGISLFYQATAIMPYSDYNGFGLMLNL